MRNLILAFIAVSALTIPHANAQQPGLRCAVTPTTVGATGSYPGIDGVSPSSNLVRYGGKALPAGGQIVYLHGTVRDESCMPLANAVIEIWQTDTSGKYTRAADAQLTSMDAVFAGSGRAITDNLGRYEFYTLFPGPYSNRAPHVHIRITHPDHPTLTTEMFFDGDRRNDEDFTLKKMAPELKARLMAETGGGATASEAINARFNVVLQGATPYKTY
jgi:protocatechuate 3,4-dioxygenase, beta subunit